MSDVTFLPEPSFDSWSTQEPGPVLPPEPPPPPSEPVWSPPEVVDQMENDFGGPSAFVEQATTLPPSGSGEPEAVLPEAFGDQLPPAPAVATEAVPEAAVATVANETDPSSAATGPGAPAPVVQPVMSYTYENQFGTIGINVFPRDEAGGHYELYLETEQAMIGQAAYFAENWPELKLDFVGRSSEGFWQITYTDPR